MDTPPLIPGFEPWEPQNTVEYLTQNPLPVSFFWKDNEGTPRAVYPKHKSVIAYGKWLKETPYFPGLFELIHKILVHARDLGDADWLAAELETRRPPKQPDLF